MAAEVLLLFDSLWFKQTVFRSFKPQKEEREVKLSDSPASDGSSTSSYLSGTLTRDPAPSIPKLQTIVSGKEIAEFSEKLTKELGVEVPMKKKLTEGKRRKQRQTKSLSDLESEELKGFMDLGFVFSEEDKNSGLASLLPGLQRLGTDGREREEEGEKIEERVTSNRPYFTEARGDLEQQMERRKLTNWKVPAFGSELDMKDNLKFWAHTVASTVR